MNIAAEAGRPGILPPPGWTASGAELIASDGAASLVVAPLPTEQESMDELAERERARLAATLPGFEAEAPRVVGDPAGEVVILPYSWQEDDGARHTDVRILASTGVAGTLSLHAPVPAQTVDAVASLVAVFGFDASGPLVRQYSTPELAALTELFGKPSFPGTGDFTLPSEPARLDARRALLARDILKVLGPGRFAMGPVDHALMSVALTANAVARVAHRRGRAEQRSQIYVGSELAVSHSSIPIGVHRLEPLPVGNLSHALAMLGELADRPTADRAAIEMSDTEFGRLRDPILRARGSAGPDDAGRVFAETRSSTQVVAAHGSAEGSSNLAWVDAGEDLGIWTIARAGGRVTLTPRSAEQVRADLARMAERLVEHAA